jgi:hypothetical protein
MSVLGNQWIAANGAPVQMTARVFTRLTTSEGPGEFIDDTDNVLWSVEPAGIVTVDRQGRVTPDANGTARVIATLGERSAFNPIRVLPDYSGTWAGEYVITGCSGAPDFRTCSRLMFGETPNRIRYPFTLTIAQDRDLISGTLVESNRAAGDIITPLTGLVRLSGALVVEATIPREGLEPFRLTNSTISFDATYAQISGAFTKVAQGRTSLGGQLYTMRTEHEFTNVARAR